jgi:8-oxo-dGTP pyrophosphatase MutT (NUDIX family)
MLIKALLTLAYQANRVRYFLTRPLTMGVKLLLVREGRFLLVQHSYQSGWHLPGGGVKRGETLEQAARREAREELGATLDELRLVGVYTNFREYKSDHMVVFASESFTLTGRTDAEIERYEFFAPENLPEALTPGAVRRVTEYVQGNVFGYGSW